MFFFEFLFATRANFLMRSKPAPIGSNSGCFGVFLVKAALSVTWSELVNQGHPLWTNRRFSAGRCNFGFQQHRDIIPTATPTFTTIADLSMMTSTSPDVGDYQFKMAATNPELEITFERQYIATRFQKVTTTFSTTPDFRLTLGTLPAGASIPRRPLAHLPPIQL